MSVLAHHGLDKDESQTLLEHGFIAKELETRDDPPAVGATLSVSFYKGGEITGTAVLVCATMPSKRLKHTWIMLLKRID